MKPKHQRLVFVLVSVVCICVAVLLVLRAFSDNLVFFFSPSDLQSKKPQATQLVRVGGLVETGTVKEGNDGRIDFSITDGNAQLLIHYQGIVPALFREGQGAIAEGYLLPNGEFDAKRILTKHDEKYMPREIVDSLKRTGHWHENP